MATIAILGTMDTKGEEHAFVAQQIKARGHQILVIDVGALDPPKLQPDITREEVAKAAGVDFAALLEPAEKALHEALAGIVPEVERALAKRDYSAALTRLATLRPAVDGFFDGVMVNAEDPALRRNRLALLAQVRHQFTRIADLSCLPG